MLRRPAITIVLITPQRIIRADFGGGKLPQLLSLKQYPRPEVQGLAALVDVAVSLRQRPGKQVLILSTDFWTQNLAMSSNIVNGLSDADLSRALSFEVESLSGISSITSALGFREGEADGETQPFWVAQSSTLERDEVESQLRRHGGKLVGLCHPGGVPGMMRTGIGRGMHARRVELWPDCAVCIYQSAQGMRHVHVINTDPDHSAWEQEAENWFALFEPPEHSELLIGDGIVSTYSIEMSPAVVDGHAYDDAGGSTSSSRRDMKTEESAGNEYHLERDEVLERWLSVWSRCVMNGMQDVPLIKPPVVPMSTQSRMAMGVSLSIIAVLICVGHYLLMNHQTAGLKDKIAKVTQPQEKYDRLSKEVGALEKQADELTEKHSRLDESLRQWHELFITQKMRHLQLLTALAKSRQDGLIIQSIENESGSVKLTGVCLHPQMANELTNKLYQQLSHSGWRVTPATKVADKQSENAETWQFEILVKPIRQDEQLAPQHVITSSLKKYTTNITGAQP